MNSKILFVDDDANLLEAIHRALRKQFTIDTAVGGEDGLRCLAAHGPYALVVADMQMPEISGLEFLRQCQQRAPDAVRIMLTGNSDLKNAMDAVNDGRVFRFLTKPCPPPTLVPALQAGLEQFRLITAERELLENTLGGAVNVLVEILSSLDPDTFDRSQRLKDYVQDFATTTTTGSSIATWELEIAALLSQIGRTTLPPALLAKMRAGSPLDDAESQLASRLSELGASLLDKIPRLQNVAQIVRYSTKRFDGSGQPDDAVARQEIPIGSRVLKVFSDLLELESHSLSRLAAFERMRERVGCYDLEVLAAVSRWCDLPVAAPGSATNAVSTPLCKLRLGQIIAQDLHTREGLHIVAKNTRLTSMLLVKLLNFGTLEAIENSVLVY